MSKMSCFNILNMNSIGCVAEIIGKHPIFTYSEMVDQRHRGLWFLYHTTDKDCPFHIPLKKWGSTILNAMYFIKNIIQFPQHL